MKILVAVKRVIDPYVKIRVKQDGTGVETQNVKMAMNPFDEIAVEQALRLKEQGSATEVVLVSIGADATQETLRHGLALGADRALFYKTEEQFEPLNIAKLLAHAVQQEQPSMVLCGKQAIDGDNNQTPQMLAALLGWPQATYASSVQLEAEELTVTREIDGGLETLKLTLPAIISTDLRLNEPRYASLPNIMKAKRKPVDIVDVASLGLNLQHRIQIEQVRAPDARKAGIKVNDVDTLLDKLRSEARVL